MKLMHHLRCSRRFFARCAVSILLYSSPALSQAPQTYSLQVEKGPLETAIGQVRKTTGAVIAYNKTDVAPMQVTAASYNNLSVEQLLKKLLTGLPLNVQKEGTTYVLLKTAPANEQPRKNEPGRISGKIIDEGNGQPVVGANIRVGNKGITTDENGAFTLSLPKGTYTATVSYIGYATKEVSEIEVKDNATFPLTVTLKRQKGQLAGVVIRASAKKETIAALYTEQKNRASMSDGISAEQIARTPDNNVGTVLKRVSGVNTIDNKYVVVRGMTERYNQAMIDGIVLPSTDMNRRNFSFDVVPVELIGSVVVNKTATPDVSSEFSGGQVIVNTLAIPVQNFTSVTIGGGYNSRSTGKDFLQIGGRGKQDYLAFDDGRRKQPEGIKNWMFGSGGGNNDNPLDFEPTALEQSKRFNPDGFKLYHKEARPNQNYRFSLGRTYNLNEKLKIGFVTGLTYRNTQEINNYTTARGYDAAGDWVNSEFAGVGTVSKFNTTWGGTLNAGIQGEKFKITLRNLYTRMFSDDAYEVYKRQNDALEIKQRSLFADPVFTDIIQNKLEGEHQLTKKGLLLNWSGARTSLSQSHKDLRSFTYGLTTTVNGKDIYQTPLLSNNNNVAGDFNYDYRLWTNVKQTDYNWMLSLSQPFNFLKNKSLIKIGYSGWQKEREQNTLVTRLFADYTNKFFDLYEPYEMILSPGRIGYGQNMAYYFADSENGGDQYKGKSKNQAFYLMLDQRFFKNLRVVYGLRAENFNSRNAQLAEIETRRRLLEMYPGINFQGRPPLETGEKNWRFLPSANVIYNLTSKANLRAAYAVTMIRPDLRETATMSFIDPLLRGPISGGNLSSTRVDNYDVRYEWYPSPGEIISVTGFYKHFDKPVELMKTTTLNDYYFTNQKSATNLGMEIEVRKSLGFIADKKWLRDLSLFGNATIMKSKVIREQTVSIPNGTGDPIIKVVEFETQRALYGQSPYIINGGINYTSTYFGLNVVYNRSGHRTYTIEDDPSLIEYENGRDVIDLQLNTRLLKQKAEIRLNISNLLDNAAMYYINPTGYKMADSRLEYIRVSGSDKYNKNEGDLVRHKINYGTTISLSFTYNF